MNEKPGNNIYQQQEAEIAKLRQTITDMENQRALETFAMQQLAPGIMLLLARTPYSKWPDVAKIAMDFAGPKAPAIADLYKSRLPTD